MQGIGIGVCCSACRVSYRPLKNDIVVVETMDEEFNKPYRLWCADLVACPCCKHRVITGFGLKHYAEHYEPGFNEQLAKADLAGRLFTITGHAYPMDDWDGGTN